MARPRFTLEVGDADIVIRLRRNGQFLGRLTISGCRLEWKERGLEGKTLRIGRKSVKRSGSSSKKRQMEE
jgi:hypothetical protein